MAMSEKKGCLQRTIARSYVLKEWSMGMYGRHLGWQGSQKIKVSIQVYRGIGGQQRGSSVGVFSVPNLSPRIFISQAEIM